MTLTAISQVRIGERKIFMNAIKNIFMNAIKNMCKNLGMKPSLGEKAEMSLTATSLFQKAG